MAKITNELLRREKEVRVYIEQHARLFDLDPNLIRGLITQESRFIAEATSPTGAYGYGQFTSIGARQVQNIARMTEKALNLVNYVKADADDPDQGIKAICATLWWLFNVKYKNVEDRKVQLEAVLTFYNAGGRPASLVVSYGGHQNAIPFIKELPKNYQSQSLKYAPEVAAWFVSWHEHAQREKESSPDKTITVNPFDDAAAGAMDVRYRALIKTLMLMAEKDETVDCLIDGRDGLTEVTLIFPGELI